MKRRLRSWILLIPIAVVISSNGAAFAADLPVGSFPAPVAIPHFPDRLHAFVWRNWGLVPVARMAKTVGATSEQIVAMGLSMGLSEPPAVSSLFEKRAYLTVIRRNWQLLPYDQMLTLLGWTADQLAFTLREDDFLYVKLGNLKPNCPRIIYANPDAKTTTREAEIAAIVRAEFPKGIGHPKEPLFGFLKNLTAKSAKGQAKSAPISIDKHAAPRFCYSYFALYGDPLIETDADPFPEGYLQKLAASGVTGVWLQSVLYKMAPFPWQPELSARYQERLVNLRKMAIRARKYGIGIWLYTNEPRAMPLDFYAAHPELKGTTEGDHAALCTSRPEVQKYIHDSVASICTAVPELGGFFTISASENLSNCWSHYTGKGCVNCSKRRPAAVIAEVNSLIQQGIHSAKSESRLIAWDWGWQDEWAVEAIGLLPREVMFMSVSEWSLPISRGGVKSEVGEYSISSIGPGPRATRHWAAAKSRGLQVVAKIQANCTWEISTVPYVPALENVAQHAVNLRGAGLDGIMLGWTLGGYPSPNLQAVKEALGSQLAVNALLEKIAISRVGTKHSQVLVELWKQFSAAYREYPYAGEVVYDAPVQLGPANLIWSEPTKYSATMVGFPYDDLDGWRGPYSPEVFINQWLKMSDQIDRAVANARKSIAGRAPAALESEVRLAEACSIHFRSVANQCRSVLSRRRGSEGTAEFKQAVQDEIVLAKRLCALQMEDSRLGFEASNQYAYVAQDLVEKVISCKYLLNVTR